jgi:hypothetical protein
MTRCAARKRCGASSASGSTIVGITAPVTLKQKARRFLAMARCEIGRTCRAASTESKTPRPTKAEGFSTRPCFGER